MYNPASRFTSRYTRFFEYFWDSLHKAVFFAVLAVSFWYLGRKAEAIWHIGQHDVQPNEGGQPTSRRPQAGAGDAGRCQHDPDANGRGDR
ncbi:MAG: hypothetical protein DME14_08055 [Candidatus Rokuibacteriota bacterium]|nr:MAG: hypothetical protein DME14_08055 [Candidatus Rokubacteria bacterium]